MMTVKAILIVQVKMSCDNDSDNDSDDDSDNDMR